MTPPNRNILWGEVLVSELAAAGLDGVCLAPGSRSTPLVTAIADRSDVPVYSHLDERSAAFFALGRGRRTGDPTAVVTTSGTAAGNLHPAVIEADAGRVPLLVITADRPPELQDSGANQTIDQVALYGDAVRWHRSLGRPDPTPRSLRSLRVTASRAIAVTTGPNPGPVHLNVPFRKPLEPTEVPGDVPDTLGDGSPLAAEGRSGPYVTATRGRATLDPADLDRIAEAVEAADRGLVVCGPAGVADPTSSAIESLATATGFPVLADPLSGIRFGPHVPSTPIVAGYDSLLQLATDWPDPDVVLRFGGSPTSKRCRHYLRDVEARQLVVDPAAAWREAEFTASDLVVADPTRLATGLADRIATPAEPSWRDRFLDAEQAYWELVDEACGDHFFEGSLLHAVTSRLPDPATMFVSNSMPVRDFDRFGRPRSADITALGNRGASGIDGIVSSGLGAASGTDDPLVLVLGDLAYYHDMNGLLAVGRCGIDATIVLVDNDGGGIFHALPIEEFDPPFTDLFKTPHGLDFAPTGELYDLEFVRTPDRATFVDAFDESVGQSGTQVLAVTFDAESSHRFRETLHDRVCQTLA